MFLCSIRATSNPVKWERMENAFAFHCRLNSRYVRFVLVDFISFLSRCPFLHFRPSTDLIKKKKVGVVKHLPLCRVAVRGYGIEDSKQWSVPCVILSHSSCKHVLRYGIRSCCVFKFCFKFSTHSLLQPSLCKLCRMWFWIVLLYKCLDIPGKDVILKAAYVALKCTFLH